MKTVLGLILVSLCCVGSASPDLVLLAFRQGDFIPHVFTDQQITRKHGAGVVSRTTAGLDRVYNIARCNTWLKLSVETDANPEYRIVRELTISSIPLSKEKFHYKGDLCKIQLNGISLGDSESQAMRILKNKSLTKKKAMLAGRHLEELYVNPLLGESDLYYRFYLKDAVIVGLAMGVTE